MNGKRTAWKHLIWIAAACLLTACGGANSANTAATAAQTATSAAPEASTTAAQTATSTAPEASTSAAQDAAVKPYADKALWAYWEADGGDAVDCFLICPTVYGGGEGDYNMPLTDEKAKKSFVGALNMERGIYDETCDLFAPYYEQAALAAYELDDAAAEPYFALAYDDVREAFRYYLENENDGRPLVLAGFSQGADMCLRLMREFYDDETLRENLVACYAIGWRLTEEDVAEHPYMKPAQGETDTGVIVTFNTEAKDVQTSLSVPETTLAINPLNWKTDDTYAPASMNLGACFTDYSGSIKEEIPALTGAYLDPVRGTLKVDDTITPADYPPGLSLFTDGVYHLYDYQFFYRNLQDNVAKRAQAWEAAQAN